MGEGFKDKLIATKQAWARAGRLLTGATGDPAHDRLPPGQKLVDNWPVLDLGVQPSITLADWRLDVDGLVAESASWSYADLRAQPQVDDISDMHCVTQWSRYDNHWQGVATRTLLERVRPLPTAKHLVIHGYDGYTTNVTLEQFSDDDCLLAHTHDGAPLAREHGGPVRLIIPRYYLWKSAKWLRRIEFVGADRPGFWETRGYHNVADPWLEQRYG